MESERILSNNDISVGNLSSSEGAFISSSPSQRKDLKKEKIKENKDKLNFNEFTLKKKDYNIDFKGNTTKPVIINNILSEEDVENNKIQLTDRKESNINKKSEKKETINYNKDRINTHLDQDESHNISNLMYL